jgi:hypothetical protein
MPRGGYRPNAGRKKGVPTKATLQKALIAERTVADARMSGRKLAKEILDDFMQLFAGMAAHHQPTPPQAAQPNPNANEDKFEKWARLAVETAKSLANYQSPTFRAIVVAPPPEEKGEMRKRFTHTVFEGSRAMPATMAGPTKVRK